MKNILKNTVGTIGINICGDESSDLNDANCSSEIIVQVKLLLKKQENLSIVISAIKKLRRSHLKKCDQFTLNIKVNPWYLM